MTAPRGSEPVGRLREKAEDRRRRRRVQREKDAASTFVPLGVAAMPSTAAVPLVEAQQVTVGTTTVSCQTILLPPVEQQVRQPLST